MEEQDFIEHIIKALNALENVMLEYRNSEKDSNKLKIVNTILLDAKYKIEHVFHS